MAQKRIKALTNYTTPLNTDVIAIEDLTADETKKITRQNFLAGAPLPANTVDTQAIADDTITNAKLSDTAGEIGGDWISYTPTLTNLTLGSGTVVALYRKVGKQVDVRIKFTLGAGSAVSSTGRFSLPVTAKTTGYSTGGIAPSILGVATIEDAGIEEYAGLVGLYSSTVVAPMVINTASTYALHQFLASTVPFVWGANDIMSLIFSYEAV